MSGFFFFGNPEDETMDEFTPIYRK